jgi:two-component system sensor histidine kinase YesM
MKRQIHNMIDLFKTRATLGRQLRALLTVVAAPFIVMIAVLLFMLYSFNQEYDITLQNANTASEFNFDFKDNLDLEMYYYVVGSSNIDHLPLEDVEYAQNVISRLEKTTTQKENQWRIRSMQNLCRRLSECMIQIKNTENYDSRIEQLEHNTYIITALIETYMHDYIYDEVRELSALQHKISRNVITTVVTTSIISMALLLFMLWYSLRFTRSITQPVRELCKKVERLGAGDFTVVPVKTNNVEIKTLDDGFNEMIGRINQLLEHVKDDQNALHRAELELLQAQINPHFLYNTFDSIVWLAEMNQNAEVVRMTTSLSTFFRNSLRKARISSPSKRRNSRSRAIWRSSRSVTGTFLNMKSSYRRNCCNIPFPS